MILSITVGLSLSLKNSLVVVAVVRKESARVGPVRVGPRDRTAPHRTGWMDKSHRPGMDYGVLAP